MKFGCPHCQHTTRLKTPDPGKYRIKCRGCQEPFALLVGDDGTLTVRRLRSKAEPQPRAEAPPGAEASASQTAKAQSAKETSAALEKTVVPQPAAPPTELAATRAHSKKERPAKSASSPRKPQKPERVSGSMPERLGGYRIIKELGRGAMGAVYRANQLALDRDVALKTVLGPLAKEPTMIARFTREAYAAAQIGHHNVVQVFDLGFDRDTNFFVMEYVPGRPLSDVVKEHGKLDAELAVSYILQAARGLQAAHSHGMVHRDVKPANLLLSDEGIVKVADLGLVKVAETPDIEADSSPGLAAAAADITLAHTTMGTAAFMAPEQADSASQVDHRADIYSLGCTLYVLLTGSAPFHGTTALELITKHKTEPIVRPDIVVNRVPAALSEIVMRMVAKDPGDRHANMGQVITDLEQFLGIKSTERFSPTDTHAETLERCVGEFNAAPAGKLRNLIVTAFPFACVGLSLSTLVVSPWLALAVLLCGGMTAASWFVTSGIRNRSAMFGQVRKLAALSRWSDRLMWIGGVLVLAAIAWAVDLFWASILISVLGIGLGIGFHFVLDRRADRERASAVKGVEGMLRGMRLKGLEESGLRHFVASYSGNCWEEFFEALFGYSAKLEARSEIEKGGSGAGRQRFRTWRDPVFRALEARIRQQHSQDEQEHLQRVQQEELKAQGVSPEDAMAQAKEIAAAMVKQALETRELAQERALATIDPAIAAREKRERVKKMLAEARSAKRTKPSPAELLQKTAGLVFGAQARFILGCLLLVGCLMWMRQNGLFSAADAKDVIQSGDVAEITETIRDAKGDPLNLPVVGQFFDSWLPGLAGLCLLVSAFPSGPRMSLFALPAAGVMMLGPRLGMPGIEAIGGAQTTCAAIGLGVFIAGFFLPGNRR